MKKEVSGRNIIVQPVTGFWEGQKDLFNTTGSQSDNPSFLVCLKFEYQLFREQRGRHHHVKPLWSFNQQEVRLQDLKKSRKYESQSTQVSKKAVCFKKAIMIRFGVMVRELEREYQRQQLTKEEESPEKEEDKELQSKDKEEEDIKLKISKASNGRFSVVN